MTVAWTAAGGGGPRLCGRDTPHGRWWQPELPALGALPHRELGTPQPHPGAPLDLVVPRLPLLVTSG